MIEWFQWVYTELTWLSLKKKAWETVPHFPANTVSTNASVKTYCATMCALVHIGVECTQAQLRVCV